MFLSFNGTVTAIKLAFDDLALGWGKSGEEK
jgi:hypothetical protein